MLHEMVPEVDLLYDTIWHDTIMIDDTVVDELNRYEWSTLLLIILTSLMAHTNTCVSFNIMDRSEIFIMAWKTRHKNPLPLDWWSLC